MDDGKTCKYDLSNGDCYGKSGKKVKGLNGILTGYNVQDVDKLFESNPQYAEFLKCINHKRNVDMGRTGGYFSPFHDYNIGTLFKYAKKYSNYEQLVSSGFKIEQISNDFKYNLSDIPKWLKNFCLQHSDRKLLTNQFIELYKQYPDYIQTILQKEYMSITKDQLLRYIKGDRYYGLLSLVEEYGYNMVDVFTYIDKLITFEAVGGGRGAESLPWIMNELRDYARMMHSISGKFERYPRHFKTTMDIVIRNYNRLKKEFSENLFKQRIRKNYEFTYKNFKFVYPDCIQDIKDEAVQQHNCVASYIDKVIEGKCHIMFLRDKSNLDKSLVTIEVRNNRIVQALQKYNDSLSSEQQEAVDAWNKYFEKKRTVAA